MAASSIDHSFTAKGLTGRSADPTYAGALSFMRRKYSKNVKGADAIVWGIPFDAEVRAIMEKEKDRFSGITPIEPGFPEESCAKMEKWIRHGPCIGIKYVGDRRFHALLH